MRAQAILVNHEVRGVINHVFTTISIGICMPRYDVEVIFRDGVPPGEMLIGNTEDIMRIADALDAGATWEGIKSLPPDMWKEAL